MSADPLTRVPGIWRAEMRVSINGEPGRFVLPSDGVPGLDWYGERGTVRHFRGAGPIEEYADATILDDPTGATTGCLQAFCRELYGIPSMHVVPEDPTATVWTVCACDETGTYEIEMPIGTSRRAPTRYEAWARALIAHYDTLAARKDGTGY